MARSDCETYAAHINHMACEVARDQENKLADGSIAVYDREDSCLGEALCEIYQYTGQNRILEQSIGRLPSTLAILATYNMHLPVSARQVTWSSQTVVLQTVAASI